MLTWCLVELEQDLRSTVSGLHSGATEDEQCIGLQVCRYGEQTQCLGPGELTTPTLAHPFTSLYKQRSLMASWTNCTSKATILVPSSEVVVPPTALTLRARRQDMPGWLYRPVSHTTVN